MGITGGTDDRNSICHIGYFQKTATHPIALNMLYFVDDQDLNSTLLKVERHFHEQIFLVILFQIILSACQDNALEKRLWAVSLWSINFYDRNPCAVALYDREGSLR